MVEDIVRWVKTVAGDVPVFPKLTPNITEIAEIAMAAERGGADGVTAINTVSGIMDTNSRGEPWPRIGSEMLTTRGGISGNQNRPVGLRACSMIKKYCPNLAIMGTGGVSSAESALQYIRMGASVVQICSSIQNQDFTVIEDYTTGLKCALFMMGRKDLKEWDGQTPPVYHDESTLSLLPQFGKYKYQRIELRKQQALIGIKGLQSEIPKPALGLTEAISDIVEAPTVNSLVNETNEKRVRDHNSLSRVEQVIAHIHDDVCINCGKCYMTCNGKLYTFCIYFCIELFNYALIHMNLSLFF